MPTTRAERPAASDSAVALIFTFCALSLMMIYFLYSRSLVVGSEMGGWVYPYFASRPPIPLWVPPVALAMLAGMVFGGLRWIERHEKLTLLGCFLLAVALQLAVQQIYPHDLGRLVASDNANSFLTPALRYTPAEVLGGFLELAPQFPLHAKGNLPGKVLLFHGLSAVTASPQGMGVLIVALSTLGGLLLYDIARRLFRDRRVGLVALILYVLLPSKQVFLPILNTVTPVGILACLDLLLAYLDTRKRAWLAALGVGLYLVVLFEPSPLAVGVLFVGVLVYALGHGQVTWRELGWIVLLPGLAFVATAGLFALAFSFRLLPALEYVVREAARYNQLEGHGYTVWLKENLKELFYAAGLPVTMLVTYAAGARLAAWRRPAWNPLRWPVETNVLVFSLLTVGAVWLLGINRGETTRLWIYLAVLLQLPAAAFLEREIRRPGLLYLVAVTLVAQSMISLQCIEFIAP